MLRGTVGFVHSASLLATKPGRKRVTEAVTCTQEFDCVRELLGKLRKLPRVRHDNFPYGGAPVHLNVCWRQYPDMQRVTVCTTTLDGRYNPRRLQHPMLTPM